jgi:hypothetical protein
MFYDLDFYHGSDTVITDTPKKPFYATTNLNYKHTKKDNLHRFKMEIKSPYYTDNISLIESIGSTPERIKLLSTLGYDCVVYCEPGNPYIGASGWGSDAAQYFILNPEIVDDWKLTLPERKSPNITRQKKIFTPRLFHSTGSHFTRFESTTDIGFHFGTKSAAQKRKKDTQSTSNVEIEKVSPSEFDRITYQYAHTEPLSEKDALIGLLLKKIKVSSPEKIVNTVSSMELDDIQKTYSEYKNKPDRPDYIESLTRVEKGEYYAVVVDGVKRSSHIDIKEARAYASAFKSSYLKEAVLIMENPLEMEDLGTWPLRDILLILTDDPVTLDYFYGIPESQQRDFVVEAIELAGYDGIKYNNNVEGGVSYIAFHAEQIHFYNPRLPELPTPAMDELHDKIRINTNNQKPHCYNKLS